MTFRMRLHGCDGSEWPLLSEHYKGVYMERGMLTGFVASPVTTGVMGARPDGSLVWSGASAVQPMQGDMPLVVDDSDGPVNRVHKRFRNAFAPDPRHKFAKLDLNDDASGLSFFTMVRLTAGIAPLPEPDIETGFERFSVSVQSDDGVWRTRLHLTGGGAVTVTNIGDVGAWVRIMWKGAGGKVIVPSGASFMLPAVSDYRILYLSTAMGALVTDMAGKVDRERWIAVRATAIAEHVPAHEARVFTIPDGSEIIADFGVYDPWKGVTA